MLAYMHGAYSSWQKNLYVGFLLTIV